MFDMNKTICATLLIFLFEIAPAYAVMSRIKDISDIEGVRYNQLIGYGLVVGLGGTGDKANTLFTVQSTVNMLRELGVFVDPLRVQTKNVASVMVTAELPPFTRPGNRIDVSISSIGDAKSLQGGTLLMTTLKAGNGEVYAVAQGPISIGGFIVKGKGGNSVQKNHVNSGIIPGGALVERDSSIHLLEHSSFNFLLKDGDFATASRVASAINETIGEDIAYPVDAKKVKVRVPKLMETDAVELIAKINRISVDVDTLARIVFNERTGTVIIGENVRISSAAVSHGGLSIKINSTPVVSQPNPLAEGKTVKDRKENVEVVEEKANLILLSEGTSVSKVVDALNAIGANPRDMIAIFQALDAAGALHAKLVIM